MKKKLTIGLFGFGCVGQGLYHVLEKTSGIKAEVKKICVKNRDKDRPLEPGLFTFNKNEILHDPQIDIIVELIDDADAAYVILKAALKNGKHVVTANKKMVAENLEEIYQLQKQYNRSVLYEGAVCGSIPILRNLEEYYDNDLISGIEGIFNGSTNYILTKVFEERKSYVEALQQAQNLGFAETDPSLDVKGTDPKYKLCIAIAHAFGLFVRPENIINIGIDKINDQDIKFARENGYTLKLVARAFKSNNQVFALVAPQFVENGHTLSNVRNEFNAVLIEGAFSEMQLFVGKGAGGYPTGSAVLSDISALTYDYRYEYKKINQANNIEFSNEVSVDVTIRFNAGTPINIHDFSAFDSGYASNGQHYMQGQVSLLKLKEWSQWDDVSVVLSHNPKFVNNKIDDAAELVSAA
jgi:homoserine dehydrogenase